MERRLEGDSGGIRRLRDLLDGEHGGAFWYDLRAHNFQPELVGTVGHSWYDMRVILEHAKPDGSSALFRALNPETWMWTDIPSRLLAYIATSNDDIRFIEAAQAYGPEDMPDTYLPAVYGPLAKPEAEPEPDNDRIERARAIGDEFR